jgi:leucyl-tRNA synthetase
LTTETINKIEKELDLQEEIKRAEKRAQTSFQELVTSLKAVEDDIGQINELTSEEKLLIAEFFSSLLKLMQPFTPAISISASSLNTIGGGEIMQAHVDPTGHLALTFADEHFELINLSDDKNRDLLISVVEDLLPKFKSLTSNYKHKVENRISLLTTITKEMQRIAETISSINIINKKQPA